MDDSVTITLSRNDLGQILDGLECRCDTWRATARYLMGEDIGAQAIEECSDAAEASAIAATYERIMDAMRVQLNPR
ncbi:MAG: hypothetical protein KDH09_19765 [Chrysiogenetes bacterium]|nr:hypothetical protein [Chrysiogenetes bacterium]